MLRKENEPEYSINEVKEILSNFFWETEYKSKITSLADFLESQKCRLEIDYKDIEAYFENSKHSNILTQLFNSPKDVLAGIQVAIEEQFFPDQIGKITLYPGLINLPDDREVRVSEIRASHIGTLIRSSGRIKKVRQVVPKMISGVFHCLRCEAIITQPQPMDAFEIKEPLECYKDQNGCKRTRSSSSWELLPEKSSFRNLQIVYLEETYDIENPHQPQTKRVFLWDDLAGIIPTNDVVVNCIVKTFQNKKTSVPEIYLEAVSYELPEDYNRTVDISEDDKIKILELMHSDEIFEKIIDSIAPAIKGYRDIKLAIALALFRGIDKEIYGSPLRGKVHICIIGDPSTAKSKILQYVEKLAPRAIYGSGEGSSGVGLTYAVTKDEIDKSWVIETGILPMANGGIAIIDEIDKMSPEDRERMHTALESGTLHIAKAGIVGTLHADCCLIAGGNPITGRFDRFTPLIQQIDLPPPLVSRFDLIFAIEDRYSDSDNELCDHILTSHMRWQDVNYIKIKPPIEPKFFRKMVAFAWEYLKPKLTEEAILALKEFFLGLRKVNEEDERLAPVSWRQLEGLIRMSEASAKIRGSDTVDKCDAELVIDLVKKSLYASCYEGGIYDFDLLTTGYKTGQRERIQLIVDFLGDKGSATLLEIIGNAASHGIDEETCRTDIHKLAFEEGRIYEINGSYRLSSI